MAQIIYFLKAYDFTSFTDPYRTIAYPEGYHGEVDDECAGRAILDGYALSEEGLYARDIDPVPPEEMENAYEVDDEDAD